MCGRERERDSETVGDNEDGLSRVGVSDFLEFLDQTTDSTRKAPVDLTPPIFWYAVYGLWFLVYGLRFLVSAIQSMQTEGRWRDTVGDNEDGLPCVGISHLIEFLV